MASNVQRGFFMEKGFFVAGVLVASVVAACSGSSPPSTFNGQPDAGGEPPPISPIVPDASQADGAAPQCAPNIPDPFTPNWIAPTKQSKCSTDDIKGYYDACLADIKQRDQCSAWRTAHADCTACIEPTDKSGPVQWHDTAVKPRHLVTVNVAGCLAIQQNKLGAADCGGTYAAAVQCEREACIRCLETGGEYEDFSTCQKAAKNQGACKSYEAQAALACEGDRDAGAPTLQCFPGTSEPAAFFQRIETIFCGQ